jgi:hypothetical protein
MLRAMQISVFSLRSFAASALALSASTWLGGCAYGEVRQVVRAQFAAEIDCPSVTVEKRLPFQEGYVENQFVARGCGETRTYTCPAGDGLVSYDDKQCSYVKGDMTGSKLAPGMPAKPAGGDTDSDMMGDDAPPADEPPAAEPEPAPKPAAKAKGGAKASPFKASGSASMKLGK